MAFDNQLRTALNGATTKPRHPMARQNYGCFPGCTVSRRALGDSHRRSQADCHTKQRNSPLVPGREFKFDPPITSAALETGDIGLFHEVKPLVLSGATRNLTESSREASATKPVHHVHGV
jgi:hypothetical protein